MRAVPARVWAPASRKLACRRTLNCVAMAAAPTSEKIKLYSVPVSNFAARCRLLVYWQGLEDRVEIVAPAELGGLKSPQYLALNPQGKMPLLVLPSGDALFESEVISQYLLDKFPSGGMEAPPTPEARARAALLTRVHDIYMGPIQACLYRDMDILTRHANVAELAKQIGVLESLAIGDPFLVGRKPWRANPRSLARSSDAQQPPARRMRRCCHRLCSTHTSYPNTLAGHPKLRRWWGAMQGDAAAVRVIDEVSGGLKDWEASDRWTKTNVKAHVATTSLGDTSLRWKY